MAWIRKTFSHRDDANGCASIGANYIHTNGGGGATRAGTASFNYNVTEVGDHTFSALYGISGGATTTVANNAPAAGAATQAVAIRSDVAAGAYPGIRVTSSLAQSPLM